MSAGEVSSRFRSLAGVAFFIATLTSVGYLIWEHTGVHQEQVERNISAIFWAIPSVLFCLITISILRKPNLAPRLRRSWRLLGFAVALLMTADIIFLRQNLALFSIADFFYVAFYFPMLAGILIFPFAPLSRRENAMFVLDLAMVLIACVMLFLYFLVDPLKTLLAQNMAALWNLIYPILDVMLAGATVVLIQRDVEGAPRATMLFLAFSNCFLVAGDIYYVYCAIYGQALSTPAYDTLMLFSRYCMVPAVAWQSFDLRNPPVKELPEDSHPRRLLRLTLPYLATATALALLLYAVNVSLKFDFRVHGVVFGALLLVAIVLYRQYLVLQENVYLYERSEQMRADSELQRSVAEKAMGAAEDASRAKSQFLSSISHELRTPLNAIIGYSEILQEESGEAHPEILPDLNKIHLASKHLLLLINDVLDLSKIEAGRMELHLDSFSPERLLQDVASTIQPLAHKNNNELSVNHNGDLGWMYGDETKVRQVLFNLLSNACKFTHDGKISLEAMPDSAPDWIRFLVSDTGIGMTKPELSRLFQAFVQADASTSRHYGGTGLGLAISDRYCRMMGGEILVDSDLGKGTTFTVRLPRRTQQIHTPAAL